MRLTVRAVFESHGFKLLIALWMNVAAETRQRGFRRHFYIVHMPVYRESVLQGGSAQPRVALSRYGIRRDIDAGHQFGLTMRNDCGYFYTGSQIQIGWRKSF